MRSNVPQSKAGEMTATDQHAETSKKVLAMWASSRVMVWMASATGI
jgi:hypothetical protein